MLKHHGYARACRFSFTTSALALAVLLSACETPSSDSSLESASSSQHSSESAYGVAEEDRDSQRYHIGKPYKIKGKWYYPKDDPEYVGVGRASWYGAAFHGRLTANGETYDMTRLTAAHPTMPLPSYARVTNLDNGSSMLVRVNDRGPFAHNRVIDLSKRAAEMLGYIGAGTAKVKVEYAGRAPIEGRDDKFLMASYRPAGSDGSAPGVMVAMNGSTPTSRAPEAGAARAFTSQPAAGSARPGIILPSTGPIVPSRPQTELAVLSYADQRVETAARAFDKVIEPGVTPAGSYLSLGSWTSLQAAQREAARLQQIGRPVMEAGTDEAGNTLFALSLYPDGHMSLDDMLRAAWAAGAENAFAVRE